MSRTDGGLRQAVAEIRTLRDEFWQDVSVPGDKTYVNQALDYAGRVADYLEFGELLALDALHRTESCGGHFREESQTPDGEALRDDEHFSYVAAWEFGGVGQAPTLHQEHAGVGEREAVAEELQVVRVQCRVRGAECGASQVPCTGTQHLHRT